MPVIIVGQFVTVSVRLVAAIRVRANDEIVDDEADLVGKQSNGGASQSSEECKDDAVEDGKRALRASVRQRVLDEPAHRSQDQREGNVDESGQEDVEDVIRAADNGVRVYE